MLAGSSSLALRDTASSAPGGSSNESPAFSTTGSRSSIRRSRCVRSHTRMRRVAVNARQPARLVVDTDGVDHQSITRRKVEHGSDALTGVRSVIGSLLTGSNDLDGTSAGHPRRYGRPQTRSETALHPPARTLPRNRRGPSRDCCFAWLRTSRTARITRPERTRTRHPHARSSTSPRSCIRGKQQSRSRYRVSCIWALLRRVDSPGGALLLLHQCGSGDYSRLLSGDSGAPSSGCATGTTSRIFA